MSTPPSPSSSEVLALLDYETAQISAGESRFGVNSWVLIGSLGALLWAAVEEAQRIVSTGGAADDAERVAFEVLALALVLSGGHLLFQALSLPRSSSEVRLTSQFAESSDTRLAAVVSVCLALGLLSAALVVAPLYTPTWWWRPVAGLQAAFILMQLLIVLMSFRDTLTTLGVTRRNRRVAMWLGWVFGIITLSLGLVGVRVFLEAHHFAPAEWRLAGVLTCIGVVSLLMAARRSGQMTHSALLEIRRQLAFGYVEPEVAKRRAEVIVMGMAVDQVFSETVSSIMRDIASIRSEPESLVRRANELRDALREKGTRDEADTERVRAVTVESLEITKKQLAIVPKLASDLKAAKHKLNGLRWIDYGVKERIGEIQRRLTDELGSLLPLVKAVREAMDDLHSAHDAMAPSESGPHS